MNCLTNWNQQQKNLHCLKIHLHVFCFVEQFFVGKFPWYLRGHIWMGPGGKPIGDCWAQDPKLIRLSRWEVKGSTRSIFGTVWIFVQKKWRSRDKNLENVIIYLVNGLAMGMMAWKNLYVLLGIIVYHSFLGCCMIFVSKLPFLSGYVVVKSSSMGISIICINHTLEDCGERWKFGSWLLNSVQYRGWKIWKILEDLWCSTRYWNSYVVGKDHGWSTYPRNRALWSGLINIMISPFRAMTQRVPWAKAPCVHQIHILLSGAGCTFADCDRTGCSR